MIFEYLNYRDYLKSYFLSLPKQGRGEARRLAEFLGVSSVVVSQTLNGQREFSQENAFKVTRYLKLNPFETQYFLKLVDYAKAGTHELKKFVLNDLKQMQEDSKKVKNQYSEHSELSDEDKFTFYSEKAYSAIRMASSLPELNSIEELAEYFYLPKEKVSKIVEFLLQKNLCVEQDGKITRGPQNTFVPASSPYIKNHHRNWRLYSMEKIDSLSESELMYTAPMSLSKKDYDIIRSNLLKTIQETVKILGPNEDEVLACMNIDFLKI